MLVQVPIERGPHAVDDLRVGQIAAHVGDAERGEAEASGSDAGHAPWIAAPLRSLRARSRICPVLRAGLLPEELTAALLEIVEERIGPAS